eukprot:187572_1
MGNTQSQINEDSIVTCEGYLKKQSLHLGQFRERWIVLKGHCLYSFKQKDDTKPTEKLNLKMASNVIRWKSNNNKFSIISNNSKRTFIAISNDNATHWIQVIEHIINTPSKSTQLTQNAKVITNTQHTIPINVKISYKNLNTSTEFVICASYITDEKMQNIFNCIKKKHYPLNKKVTKIYSTSFTGKIKGDQIANISHKSLTDYKKHDIMNKGLSVKVQLKREHKVNAVEITCKFMNDVQMSDPLECPIYFKMKEKHEYTFKNLQHLNEFDHFEDEFGSKSECQYFDECKAYIRLENGNNKIKDLCHMKIFRHPPRNRNIKLSQNIHSLIFNQKCEQNQPIYEPTLYDEKTYNYNEWTGYLNALIEEVISNGYKYDLCLECEINEE